jgi:hypothetical protein
LTDCTCEGDVERGGDAGLTKEVRGVVYEPGDGGGELVVDREERESLSESERDEVDARRVYVTV